MVDRRAVAHLLSEKRGIECGGMLMVSRCLTGVFSVIGGCLV